MFRGETIVRLRPHLVVQSVSAPDEVLAGSDFSVSAMIAEVNGDTDATATVEVLNGSEVLDTAGPFAISAGGAKGVVFLINLSDVGTYTLTLRISNFSPGEYDTSNNKGTFTVNVIQPNKPLQYSSNYYYYDVLRLSLGAVLQILLSVRLLSQKRTL